MGIWSNLTLSTRSEFREYFGTDTHVSNFPNQRIMWFNPAKIRAIIKHVRARTKNRNTFETRDHDCSNEQWITKYAPNQLVPSKCMFSSHYRYNNVNTDDCTQTQIYLIPIFITASISTKPNWQNGTSTIRSKHSITDQNPSQTNEIWISTERWHTRENSITTTTLRGTVLAKVNCGENKTTTVSRKGNDDPLYACDAQLGLVNRSKGR